MNLFHLIFDYYFVERGLFRPYKFENRDDFDHKYA